MTTNHIFGITQKPNFTKRFLVHCNLETRTIGYSNEEFWWGYYFLNFGTPFDPSVQRTSALQRDEIMGLAWNRTSFG